MIPYAAPFDFLEWYFANADFGPAHEDVVNALFERFEEEMHLAVPEEYREGY